jgi:type II secretory pathway component PulF
LGQTRGFLDAINRQEAAFEARLLSLIAVGTRGDAKNLDQALDRLIEHANQAQGT